LPQKLKAKLNKSEHNSFIVYHCQQPKLIANVVQMKKCSLLQEVGQVK